MRPVDADALKTQLYSIIESHQQIYGRLSFDLTSRCMKAIDNAPTIDVEGYKKRILEAVESSGLIDGYNDTLELIEKIKEVEL